MSTNSAQPDAIKVTISSGSATNATVTNLQCLLGLQCVPQKLDCVTHQKGSAATKLRSVGQKNHKISASSGVLVFQDTPKPLPPKERYGLATDVVNLTLQLLGAASKTGPQICLRDAPLTPGAASKSSSTSQRAPQPRLGNTTPVSEGPGKPTICRPIKSADSKEAKAALVSHLAATAECARLAFSFLRAADTRKLGVRDIPKWQIETGTLSLAGRLIALGLEIPAVKELRIVKRRLQPVVTADGVPRSTNGSKPAPQPEKETITTLLRLDPSITDKTDVLPLVITYQQLVLKLITASGKPAVVEAAAEYLSLDYPVSPGNIIRKHTEITGDSERGAKKLEVLAQTILGLCPSASSGNDETACSAVCPSPITVFKLQTWAFLIRRTWWKLSGHHPDLSKEIEYPFSRCLAAYVRRSGILGCDKESYKTAKAMYGRLGLDSLSYGHGDAQLDISSSMASLAEETAAMQEALQWAKKMSQASGHLDIQHARRVATLVHALALSLCAPGRLYDGDDISVKLDAVAGCLRGQLKGHASDYDRLLSKLAQLLRTIMSNYAHNNDHPSTKEIIHLAASFVLRYSRSYPGRNTDQALSVITGALRWSRTTEDLDVWITKDALTLFITAGTLQQVTEVASRKPMSMAWSSSGNAIALGRVLRALLLKQARSQSDCSALLFGGDDNLEPLGRAALLEWQLTFAAELLHRRKYRQQMRKFISEALRALNELYTSNEHPIRRTRVAGAAFRFCETDPDVLSPYDMKIWQNEFPLEPGKIGKDEGLTCYMKDAKATLAVARAFSDGRPATETFIPALDAWRQIIENAGSAENLHGHIDDTLILRQQLNLIASYLGMAGDGARRLHVLHIIAQLSQVFGDSLSQQCSESIALVQQYLELGYSEKAGMILAQAEELASKNASEMAMLQLEVARAQYLLAVDNVNSAEDSLERARNVSMALKPDRINKEDSRAFEMVHAHGWLIQSFFYRDNGLPNDALYAAKQSVRLLNGLWAAIERSIGQTKSTGSEEPDVPDIASLTTGVSKLDLTPKDEELSINAAKLNGKGPQFWQIVPVLWCALRQLSAMYAHHGLFGDADYYARRAVEVTESVKSEGLLCQALLHRCRLFVIASKLEEAELCLTRCEEISLDGNTIADIDRLCAKATLRANEGLLDESMQLYEEAICCLRDANTSLNSHSEKLQDGDGDITQRPKALKMSSREAAGDVDKQPTRRTKRKPAPTKKTISKKRAVQTQVRKPKDAEEEPSKECDEPYLLRKLKTSILLEKALLSLRSGAEVELGLDMAKQLFSSISGTLRQRRVQFYSLMQKASLAMECDLSYSILPESTLSFPALVGGDRRPSEIGRPRPSLLSPTSRNSRNGTAKGSAHKSQAIESFVTMLLAAKECLAQEQMTYLRYSTTADTHSHGSMLSSVTMLLSAAALRKQDVVLHPARQALSMELPKMHALHCDIAAVGVDSQAASVSAPLSWAEEAKLPCPSSAITASDFQEQYVDILPSAWTAVSLGLNEECTELYAIRYRAGQSPLIVRLPFSRQKHDADDGEEEGQETFDYYKCRAELQDIIQLSDISCHNGANMGSKGAKSKWWIEREELDRRLRELLVNIENIWFGGFKGIFWQQARHLDLLARFRKAFEDTLSRHLPSRRAPKGLSKPLVFDNKVLELFVGLGHDQNGVVDLDEPLADLLYFIVDMLQFNGERNAYDEIDFDSMAVDVLDALRSYHEASAIDEVNRHLILVLDKRLQAFPWENLPYLDGSSVSRVGNMQTLRERIIAMRAQNGIAGEIQSDNADERHVVDGRRGTYILNPSRDLVNTESTLSPPLARLAAADDASWASMVQKAPSEDDFGEALTRSPLFLYFGHGSGAQYIRPRKIKKLKKCSDVVWLMGCSSGAITEYGELEPFAVPLAYMMAGQNWPCADVEPEDEADKHDGKCMAVVATLWDVTDKDIDRFSLAMGEEWGLFPPSEASKLPVTGPRKRPQSAVPAPPQRMPKTPKRSTAAHPPSRSRSRPRDQSGRKKSLVEAVANSRDACYLRYLNGAAPVVYGVPVYLGD